MFGVIARYAKQTGPDRFISSGLPRSKTPYRSSTPFGDFGKSLKRLRNAPCVRIAPLAVTFLAMTDTFTQISPRQYISDQCCDLILKDIMSDRCVLTMNTHNKRSARGKSSEDLLDDRVDPPTHTITFDRALIPGLRNNDRKTNRLGGETVKI